MEEQQAEKTPPATIGAGGKPQVNYRLRPPRAGQASATAIILTTLWVLVLLALGTWSSYHAEQRQDQYQLIHLGQQVQEGGHLYVDAWENKPPGMAWINAVLLTLDPSGLATWIFPGLLALLSLGVFARVMAHTLNGNTACLAVILAAVVVTLRLYDTPSINPDFYAASLELLGLSFFIAALVASTTGRKLVAATFSGWCFAGGLCVKQAALAGPVVFLLVSVVAILLRFPNRKRFIIATTFLWTGLLFGCLLVVALLDRRGNLDEAYAAIFTFNRGLLSPNALMGALGSWDRAWGSLSTLQLPLWLAMLGLVVTLTAKKAGLLTRSMAVTLTLWLLAATFLALLGLSGSMRYYQALFPPALWLAGLGLFHLQSAYSKLEKGYRSVVVVAAFTLLVVLGKPLMESYLHGVARSHVASLSPKPQRAMLSAMGAEIRELVPEGKSIYVLAYDPGVYVHAQRRAASRFTYPRSAKQMQEILGCLLEGKAYAILTLDKLPPQFARWCDDTCQASIATLTRNPQHGDTFSPYHIVIPSKPSPSITATR